MVIIKVVTRDENTDRFADSVDHLFNDWLDAGTFIAKFDSTKPDSFRFMSVRETV